MYTLVLIRHGQSTWNKENLFTGWTDVELSEKGIDEAKKAGQRLKEEGYTFDLGFTSVLKRAIDTLDLALKEMKIKIPIKKTWKLNERHYGDLQGKNKAEVAQEVGDEQVLIWRRSYGIPPPAIEKSDKRYPGNDPLYKDLKEEELPLTETLKDTVKRVLPYWEEKIVPEIKAGKKVIISAHGNSLRALVKHLDEIHASEVLDLNIPTGVPLVYELDEELKPIQSYYLE